MKTFLFFSSDDCFQYAVYVGTDYPSFFKVKEKRKKNIKYFRRVILDRLYLAPNSTTETCHLKLFSLSSF